MIYRKYIMHEWNVRVECSLCMWDTDWHLDYEFAKNQWNYRPVEDALLARIAELEAALAECDEWEPVPDGLYTLDNGTLMRIMHNGTCIWTKDTPFRSEDKVFLPDDMRVFRQRPQPAARSRERG